MERLCNGRKILILIGLPTLFVSCGGRPAQSFIQPEMASYSFSIECRETKVIDETVGRTLVDSGFVVSAQSCDTGCEEFTDIARYDAESGLFRTEGFYRQSPGDLMNFFASWPEQIYFDGEGKAVISISEALPQKDQVVASAFSVDGGGGCISLNFKHILGRLKIYARGIDPMVSYSLNSLSVASPAKAFYNLADDVWHTAQYCEIAVKEGDDTAVIPGTVLISADWTCECENTIIASYHRTASVEVGKGKITAVTLLLSNDGAEELCFDTEVSLWQGNPVSIEL